MKKNSKWAISAGTMTLAATLSSGLGAAGSVTTTADNCASAWAILLTSHPSIHGSFPHTDYKDAITGVVNNNRYWTVGEYERIIAQKFTLETYDTKFHEGGTAYVAHCGSGATCNALASEVLKAYPDLGSPVVYCHYEAPHILDNPSPF
jgi:hypothetical protein